MSDTPRTDALKGTPMTRHDSDSFARMLERENGQLRRLLGVTLEDAARLDWMNLHQASIEVTEPDPLTCRVEASDDYKLVGAWNPYDVRKAIDIARKAES